MTPTRMTTLLLAGLLGLASCAQVGGGTAELAAEIIADVATEVAADVVVDTAPDLPEAISDAQPEIPDALPDLPEEVDAVDAGPMCTVDPPAHVPSAVAVQFEIVNTGAKARWVAQGGTWCDAWAVTGAPRATGYHCGCACPEPAVAATDGWVLLQPGESYIIGWDARRMEAFTRLHTCADGETICLDTGALLPLAPGTYTVRIGATDTLPAHCVADPGEPEIFCAPPADAGAATPPSPQALCPELDTVAEATFDLPASGELTVTLDVGTVVARTP